MKGQQKHHWGMVIISQKPKENDEPFSFQWLLLLRNQSENDTALDCFSSNAREFFNVTRNQQVINEQTTINHNGDLIFNLQLAFSQRVTQKSIIIKEDKVSSFYVKYGYSCYFL